MHAATWRLAVAVSALMAGLDGAHALQEQETREPVRHALLVGCSEYPELRKALGEVYEREHALRGPAKDVELVKETLRRVMPLAPAHTTVLAGWPDDLRARPTYNNIRDALVRLAHEAHAGDQVIVYLAGHGSQQRVQRIKTDEEPDGLEEIFLPADVRPAEKDQG